MTELEIRESWDIYDELENAFVAYHSPKVNKKWVEHNSFVTELQNMKRKPFKRDTVGGLEPEDEKIAFSSINSGIDGYNRAINDILTLIFIYIPQADPGMRVHSSHCWANSAKSGMLYS